MDEKVKMIVMKHLYKLVLFITTVIISWGMLIGIKTTLKNDSVIENVIAVSLIVLYTFYIGRLHTAYYVSKWVMRYLKHCSSETQSKYNEDTFYSMISEITGTDMFIVSINYIILIIVSLVLIIYSLLK